MGAVTPPAPAVRLPPLPWRPEVGWLACDLVHEGSELPHGPRNVLRGVRAALAPLEFDRWLLLSMLLILVGTIIYGVYDLDVTLVGFLLIVLNLFLAILLGNFEDDGEDEDEEKEKEKKKSDKVTPQSAIQDMVKAMDLREKKEDGADGEEKVELTDLMTRLMSGEDLSTDDLMALRRN